MSQQELLKQTVLALESTGVPYMITGSHASSLQGQPRATHDIDLAVQLDVEVVPSLLRHFPADTFYVSESAAIEAAQTAGMFNIVNTTTGDKVDFWVVSGASYDRERFARRQQLQFLNQRIWVISPEDTILSKLLWAKQSGGSEKQFSDALAVYEFQRESLDEHYLDHWAFLLDLNDALNRLRKDASR